MQKCISTILSILLLLGATGMVFGQHYCEGQLVDKALAFGVEKMSCTPAEADESCDDSIEDAGCCEDVHYQVQIDTDFVNKAFDILFELPVFDTSDNFYSLLAANSVKEERPEMYYLPPDFDTDRLSLYQVFLI